MVVVCSRAKPPDRLTNVLSFGRSFVVVCDCQRQEMLSSVVQSFALQVAMVVYSYECLADLI